MNGGHRTDEEHDCFLMNCKALGHELEHALAEWGRHQELLRAVVSEFQAEWNDNEPWDHDQGVCLWCYEFVAEGGPHADGCAWQRACVALGLM